MISEAMAMFIIIAFGDSAACMYSLYDPSPYKQAYWGVCISWGLAVTIAIYVTGGVSGAHTNPAVSLAMALWRGFSWKKVIPYSIAQVAGAFLGALVVYVMFSPVIDHFNAVNHLTRAGDGGAAGVFFTHPGESIAGNYWWVPIVGPLIGGPIGAGAYQFLVRPYLPPATAPRELSEPAVVLGPGSVE